MPPSPTSVVCVRVLVMFRKLRKRSMRTSEGARDIRNGMKPARDMSGLRRMLKSIDPASGDICRTIESAAFTLSERGFTMLIVSCRRCNRWEKAMEIFRAMKGDVLRSKGIRPNFYTYTSLISVCSAAGACSQGLQVLEEMRLAAESNPDIVPDVQVYETLIVACHLQHKSQDVVKLYGMMKTEWSQEVSREALICVMEAFGDIGKWDQAFELLEVMAGMSQEVLLSTYTRLLCFCVNQGTLDTAVEIFLAMQMWGVHPDPIICHYMIQAAASVPNIQMCLELTKSMREAGLEVTHSTSSYLNGVLGKPGALELATGAKIDETAKERGYVNEDGTHYTQL